MHCEQGTTTEPYALALRSKSVHLLIVILIARFVRRSKTMPNPQQIREQRIQELVDSFDSCPEFVDSIIRVARAKFPLVRDQTIYDYGAAAYRILKDKK